MYVGIMDKHSLLIVNPFNKNVLKYENILYIPSNL